MSAKRKPTYDELVALLVRANEWLNDYDLKMQGSYTLAAEIDTAIDAATAKEEIPADE